ncbi:metallophosphoesterase family protein [Planctomycetes bacterium K23_9]|uniref:Serine/threonine-protein phosphatase 1 n=1 Tax=Stieleria marina TaxID=1930275 RepID=A0A517NZU7_9BACT|nr:Serine/threonine-protein phosphatase 1 [Planctomycetes bacterium K23_9]
MRRFVIGDIHGCAKSLRTLIETIAPSADDEIVFLGDYVDRGPSSRDVVEQIVQLKEQCRVVALRGNHEIMLMAAAFGGVDSTAWMNGGGLATVSSYGGSLRKMPVTHITFFQELRPYYETENEIFVHAGYNPQLPMREQLDSTIYWTHLPDPAPAPHRSGKRVFVGHTPQPFGQILNLEHLVCVDTYCFGNGYLSAMDIDTGDVIQVDRHGHLRRDPLADFTDQLGRGWSRCKKLVLRLTRRSVAKSAENNEPNDEPADGTAEGKVRNLNASLGDR